MSDGKFAPPNKKPLRGRDGRANNRPPEHTRFKPGQSGNPKGKPKENPTADALLRKILGEKVQIREGNRVITVTKLEAMHRGFVVGAMKGNPKAFKTLRDLFKDDPTILFQQLPLVNFIFSDYTLEEQKEFDAWRAAKKSETDGPS
jgi:hypothetical protein